MSGSGENTGGLMSSAGLVRYFDSEDRNAPKIDPKTDPQMVQRYKEWGEQFGS